MRFKIVDGGRRESLHGRSLAPARRGEDKFDGAQKTGEITQAGVSSPAGQ